MRSQRRGVRPGDEFVDDAALHADAASRHRGRGDRQSLSPGERDDAVGRGADVPRPDTLNAHGDARHPGAAVRCAAANACCQERGRGAFAGSGNGCERNAAVARSRPTVAKDRGGSAFPGSDEGLHALQRQQPARPGDAREVRAGDRDHAGAAAPRSAFLEVVVEYPLDQGFPAFLWDHSRKLKTEAGRVAAAGGSSRCGGRVERLPGARRQPLRPRAVSSSVTSCPGID